MIAGFATPAGTRRYATRHEGIRFNSLPGLDLQVAPAGFGGYRIDGAAAGHREALRQALLGGVNLVDTSANYSDGGSERLIGEILAELIGDRRLQRDEMVIVSKAGYIQGANIQISQAREREGRPFPDLVMLQEGLAHCIHPEFLEDQLTRSLQRLGLGALDIFLLHNPEYYLTWAARSGVAVDMARHEYQRRLELAFTYLEGEVTGGRISAYGVSSNTFPGPVDDPSFTSLAMVWETAQRAAAGKNVPALRVIQLPFNLLEPEAVTRANQPDGTSVLAYAAARGLGVLVNRPLNAIVGNNLIRLANLPDTPAPAADNIAESAAALAAAEEILLTELLPRLGLDPQQERGVAELFNSGRLLQARWAGFGSWHNWRDVQERFIVPRIQSGAQFLAGQPALDHGARAWLDEYVSLTQALLRAVGLYYQSQSAARAAVIKEAAASAAPEWAADTLSQTAVRALRSTRGVSVVLVGMRNSRYVADVVAELYRPVEPADRAAAWRHLARQTAAVTGESRLA